ncbi:hypothetical protein NOK12_33080 [Nocardioides sp. OK12]|nr:hypothetical protein NOK12_33080 [Nocardioides sp. OK12]
MPPAVLMAVATAPTTPWSGAVCRRMVIEYDEVVADLDTCSPSAHRAVTGKSDTRPHPLVTLRTKFCTFGSIVQNALHG